MEYLTVMMDIVNPFGCRQGPRFHLGNRKSSAECEARAIVVDFIDLGLEDCI